jgi:hypothetical protein
MSITTDAPVAATLPEAAAKPAKRTPRKAAPGKAVAPAKATKAPAKAKADKQMYIASAKGRGGEINRRKVGFATAWGVDVADSSAKKAALVAGQI